MAKRKAAVAVLCLAIAAGVLSALPSSGQAAGSGCGTTALDCTQTEYGCYGVSGVRRPPGAPPICQAEPPSTP